MGADAFGGAWRVRETVFSPAGERLGEVAQRRRLEDAGAGRIRVLQDCEPDAALREAAHPMASFAGHHVFTLSREGAARRYHGPAVVGGALALGEGAMLGRGAWPAFGWSFTSWSVLVAPDRQVTGGRFHRGGTPMATIVGVAAPEVESAEAPTLGAVRWPGEVARTWRGLLRRVDGVGRVLGEEPVSRRYLSPLAWQERELAAALAPRDDAFAVSGAAGGAGGKPLHGFLRRFGWALEGELVVGADTLIESMEIFDEARGHLVVLRRWLVDQTPRRAEVLRLRPEADA
jgi:hypothetical protein